LFVTHAGGITSSITLFNNEFMTLETTAPAPLPGMEPRAKDSIGPELGIGGMLENYTSDPIMLLKSCIGDRALGWDLLPPGTPR
jgi:hypothetical protein